MPDMLAAARSAAEYGWPVFRLRGKRPLKDTHGLLDATTDLEQIEAWWAEDPSYNVGVATGPAGLAVIDIDSPEAQHALEERYGRLPDTAVVETRPGRRHLLYAGTVKTTTGSNGGLAPKVDTRGEGGYIVLPPSIHPDTGKPYRWVDKRKPAPLPAWVAEALRKPSDNGSIPELPKGTTPYGQAVLNGELSKLVQTPDGSRNDRLIAVACRLFELVKAGEIDQNLALDGIKNATASWIGNPPGSPFTETERQRTLQSAWDRTTAKPPEHAVEVRPVEPATEPGVYVPRWIEFDELSRIPPPKWLIPLVLPEGYTVLYGRRGAGKTFLALDMSLVLVSHGYTVVYCPGEGASGLGQRTQAWVQDHPEMDPRKGRFVTFAFGEFPKLAREQSVLKFKRALHELANQGTPPDLVVVDTLRRTVAPQSVSDDAAIGAVVEALDDIKSLWGTSSLVLHHPKRPQVGAGDPSEAGSGAIGDDADAVWKVKRRSDDSPELMMLNEKVKEWEEPPAHRLRLKPVGDSLVISPSVADFLRGGPDDE